VTKCMGLIMADGTLPALLLTFLCGAAYECGCVFWVAHSEAGRARPAVAWSMFNALVTCVGVEHFLRGPHFVAAIVLGYGVGTWGAIRIRQRVSQ